MSVYERVGILGPIAQAIDQTKEHLNIMCEGILYMHHGTRIKIYGPPGTTRLGIRRRMGIVHRMREKEIQVEGVQKK